MVNETTSQESGQQLSGGKSFFVVLWIFSLLLVGFFSFKVGKGSKEDVKPADKVLGALQNVEAAPTAPPQPTSEVPLPTQLMVATPTDTPACQKSGLAQKWEYLTAYIVKEGDSLQSIATAELGDAGRTNEILQLNGVGPYISGSTLYLPPKSITKSNGKIQLVRGKLIEKNASSWQLSFNDDKKGQGLLIPTFWFADIQNKDNYKVGDCVSILFDEGFKVFSVNLQ